MKSGRLTVPPPQWLDWSTYYRLFSSSALPSYFLFSLLCLASFLQSTLVRWRPSPPPPSQVASSVPGSVHLLASLVPTMLSSCPAQFLSSSVPAQPIRPSPCPNHFPISSPQHPQLPTHQASSSRANGVPPQLSSRSSSRAQLHQQV